MVKRSLFFSNKVHLSASNNQLIIHKDEKVLPRAIEDIGFIVLEHPQITFTQFAAEALLENNTSVIFCGKDHLPKGMLLPLTGHQLQNERFRHQVKASGPLMKNLWMQTVKAKIWAQHRVLEISGSAVNLKPLADNVLSGDPKNVEGMAAKRYWKAIFGPNFNRQRYGDSPNNFLNYGYAILRAATARALTGSGLLPTLGIHHHNRNNAYCLADDIMEPYRPFVDREILALQDEGFTDSPLTTETKQRLINLLQADTLIGKKNRPLMIALTESSSSLAQCFMGEKKKITYGTFAD
jgi:CRISPR-associated protein Cas1